MKLYFVHFSCANAIGNNTYLEMLKSAESSIVAITGIDTESREKLYDLLLDNSVCCVQSYNISKSHL